MTTPLIVRIIFSGLIMLASDGGRPSKQVALLVDSASHKSFILLAEGTCESDGSIFDAECVDDGDLAPYFSELWVLEDDAKYELSLEGTNLYFGRQHRRTGRPHGPKGADPMPSAVDHIADASWLPSMQWVLDEELDADCLDDDDTLTGCPHVRARFRLPMVAEGPGNESAVGVCHLLHGADLSIFKGVADACQAMEDGTASGKERIRFVELKSADEELEPQKRALGNGFMVEIVSARHPIGEPIELQLEVSGDDPRSDRIELQPKQIAGQQVLTILVFNEPSADEALRSARVSPQAYESLLHLAGDRTHFSEYCEIFGRDDDDCKNPEVTNDVGVMLEVGTCERYLDCLDAIMLNSWLMERANPSQAAPSGPGAQAVSAADFLMFPHSSGVCDTSGYP